MDSSFLVATVTLHWDSMKTVGIRTLKNRLSEYARAQSARPPR